MATGHPERVVPLPLLAGLPGSAKRAVEKVPDKRRDLVKICFEEPMPAIEKMQLGIRKVAERRDHAELVAGAGVPQAVPRLRLTKVGRFRPVVSRKIGEQEAVQA